MKCKCGDIHASDCTTIVPLPQKEIDRIFSEALTQADYTIGLHKFIYGEETWEQIIRLKGFPQTSKALNLYVMGKAIEFDSTHHGSMPGGMWMNNGFSTDESMTGFFVRLSEWE